MHSLHARGGILGNCRGPPPACIRYTHGPAQWRAHTEEAALRRGRSPSSTTSRASVAGLLDRIEREREGCRQRGMGVHPHTRSVQASPAEYRRQAKSLPPYSARPCSPDACLAARACTLDALDSLRAPVSLSAFLLPPTLPEFSRLSVIRFLVLVVRSNALLTRAWGDPRQLPRPAPRLH